MPHEIKYKPLRLTWDPAWSRNRRPKQASSPPPKQGWTPQLSSLVFVFPSKYIVCLKFPACKGRLGGQRRLQPQAPDLLGSSSPGPQTSWSQALGSRPPGPQTFWAPDLLGCRPPKLQTSWAPAPGSWPLGLHGILLTFIRLAVGLPHSHMCLSVCMRTDAFAVCLFLGELTYTYVTGKKITLVVPCQFVSPIIQAFFCHW